MSKSIDWDYWRKLPEIKAFEAIALLHGAEPESEPPEDASPEYRKALRLLLACLSDRSIFTPGMLNLVDPALHGVKLIEVGAWAKANGYSLPDKFPRPTADLTAIDWAFWRNMRTVKLWQACALVVGFDPDKLRHSPHGWMAGPGAGPVFVDRSFPGLEGEERFGKALRLAESAVSYMNGPIFPQGTPAPDHKQEKDVFLSQVVAHFVACEWANIPEPLHAIAKAAAPVATPKQVNTPAIASVQSDNTGLLALTTGDIAFCFDGLRWSEQEWRKPLGDKPKWLQACVHTPGQRGVFETRWNPVSIGAALVRDGHAPAKSVRARFQTKDLLKPWLDTWKTYEADNLNTE